MINLYIFYTLTPWIRNLNTGFTLITCLFISVKLTKNADPDKCKYSGHNIRFDSRWEFSFTVETREEMSLFLELIWAHPWTLIIKIKIS